MCGTVEGTGIYYEKIGVGRFTGKGGRERIYCSLCERMKRPFVMSGGQELFITAGVGVASYPEAAKNALELVNCAGIVMLREKTTGKGSIFGIEYFGNYPSGTIIFRNIILAGSCRPKKWKNC